MGICMHSCMYVCLTDPVSVASAVLFGASPAAQLRGCFRRTSGSLSNTCRHIRDAPSPGADVRSGGAGPRSAKRANVVLVGFSRRRILAMRMRATCNVATEMCAQPCHLARGVRHSPRCAPAPLPHLTGTGLTNLCPPPHLRREWAHPCDALHGTALRTALLLVKRKKGLRDAV